MIVVKSLYSNKSIKVLFILTLSLTLAAGQAFAALYQGEATIDLAIRQTTDISSDALAYYKKNDKVDIVSVDLEWLTVQKGNVTGYVPRRLVNVVKRVDATEPYGVIRTRHAATLTRRSPLRESPSSDARLLLMLPENARLAIVSITGGWVKLLYNRQFAYVHASNIAELEPVARNADSAKAGSIIAAFQTEYDLSDTELNNGRMANIEKACEYLNGSVIEPGAEMSFNSWIGPFSAKRGFKQAPVLIDGKAVPGSGGGTCQVSTTLYNALLSLPGVTIVYRRAHGPSGATYVPHGVDAAVGNSSLDLVFRNDYDFPLVMSANAAEGVLYIEVRR